MYTRSNPNETVLIAPALHKRQQVARHIRALAASMIPGDRLPSVSDLERQLGVARKTVVAALDLLQQEGVVEARPRSGTFVAERQTPIIGGSQQTRQSQRSNAIALFAFRPTDYYLTWINRLVVQAAAMGLDVECQYTSGTLDQERIANALAGAPLGAIVFSNANSALFQQFIDAGRRVVVITEPRIGVSLPAPYVCSDAERGGFLAAQHLLDLGHRRISYVHWMPDNDDLLARRRFRGHKIALAEAGLTEAPHVIDPVRFGIWREYPEVLRHDLSQPNAPTAFVAWSDIEASALVTALQRAGLVVPSDVSVIGYDNLPDGVESEPRLTTIDQNMTELAHSALSLLLDPSAYQETRAAQAALAINDEVAPACLPRLIRRESTASIQ